MSLADSMPLVRAFHVRSAGIYHATVSRFKQKVNKRGNVIRAGRIVPYTLAEFRTWLLEQLGGKQDGSVRCCYCSTPLFADTLRVDHDVPASCGGSLALVNLRISCDLCNRAKGGLTAAEFLALRIVLDEMLHDGRLGVSGFQDVWRRLRGQLLKFRSFASKKTKPKPGTSGLLVDHPEQAMLLPKRLPKEENF